MTTVMTEYALAYADIHNHGFSEHEPYVHELHNMPLSECQVTMQKFKDFGFQKVCLFVLPKKALESYTWNYVHSHEVTGKET